MYYQHVLFPFVPILCFLYGCGEHKCNLGDIICDDNNIYACYSISNGYGSNAGSQFVLLMECSKYGSYCQENTPGYFPDYEGGPIFLQRKGNVACVVPQYHCDGGDDTDCYNNAIVSCNINLDGAVITNTSDNDSHVNCP